MSRATTRLSRAYARLLRLYPASFREEYGEEMCVVFSQAIDEARSAGCWAPVRRCLSELLDWPAAIAREWAATVPAHNPVQGAMNMDTQSTVHDLDAAGSVSAAPERWHETLLAAAGLFVPGLALALTELPALRPWTQALVFGAYLFTLAGVLVGWVRRFPRWSYVYVGYAVLFSLYLSTVSTPGLRVLGYTFARHERWGWRACLPPAAVVLLGLLVTRSLRPLGGLFTGVWRDWTRLSLALYGALPLPMWAVTDEVHSRFLVPMLLVIGLCLAAGAAVHMRSRTGVSRLLALLGGLALPWLLSSIALAFYWTSTQESWAAGPVSWTEMALPMLAAGAVLLVILAAPALLVVLRRRVGSWRAA